jgi:hypothetical protein
MTTLEMRRVAKRHGWRMGCGESELAFLMRKTYELGRAEAHREMAERWTVTLPPDAAYLVDYADVDRAPELYTGDSARSAAIERYEQAAQSWTCRLYVAVDQSGYGPAPTTAVGALAEPECPAPLVVPGPYQPVERDHEYERDYYPLPGGWEVQTKGRGSSFRLCDPEGERLNVPPSPYLYDYLSRLGRDVNTAWRKLCLEAAS